jgi:predicted nuclease with RNAse H fold
VFLSPYLTAPKEEKKELPTAQKLELPAERRERLNQLSVKREIRAREAVPMIARHAATLYYLRKAIQGTKAEMPDMREITKNLYEFSRNIRDLQKRAEVIEVSPGLRLSALNVIRHAESVWHLVDAIWMRNWDAVLVEQAYEVLKAAQDEIRAMLKSIEMSETITMVFGCFSPFARFISKLMYSARQRVEGLLLLGLFT